MALLYRTAEWHGLAKLRMHTESTLDLLQSLTTEFGMLMRDFHELTCSDFTTLELPREKASRQRRTAKTASSSQSTSSGQAQSTPQSTPDGQAQSTPDGQAQSTSDSQATISSSATTQSAVEGFSGNATLASAAASSIGTTANAASASSSVDAVPVLLPTESTATDVGRTCWVYATKLGLLLICIDDRTTFSLFWFPQNQKTEFVNDKAPFSW